MAGAGGGNSQSSSAYGGIKAAIVRLVSAEHADLSLAQIHAGARAKAPTVTFISMGRKVLRSDTAVLG